MRRKIIIFSCMIIAILGLTACSKKTNKSDDVLPENEIDYLGIAEQCATEMASDDFEGTLALFNDEMKNQISEDTLVSAWDQTVASIGAYQEVYSNTIDNSSEHIIVKTILKYEQSGLAVFFSFDDQGLISGLQINYYTIPSDTADTDTYYEQELQIGEYSLEGRIMLPKNVENPPVVIMVQGSGPSDMNETIGSADNQMFHDLAIGLAEKGIATIRYNKRYYQCPELATDDVTIQDEVISDVNSAIQYAVECELVDSNRIFVLGHSLGGMLVPAIAAENESVAAIISMAGSPRNFAEIMYDQSEEVINNSGLTPDEIETQLSLLQGSVDSILLLQGDEDTNILGINSEYWFSLNELQATKFIDNFNIPMLILQGDADFQVSVEKDYNKWLELLDGKENVTFHLYENLNHLFMQTNGKRDTSEYDIEGNVDLQVIDDIADWIIQL